MTVSRVLRGTTGRYTPQTRDRVLAAAAELRYRRNEAARSLRLRRGAGLIGLIVTNLANPFYSRLALGVESLAVQQGFGVVLGNTGEDPRRERNLIRDLTDHGVDGIIAVPAGDDQSHLGPPALNGIPVVFASRPATGIAADCVLVDDFGGAHAATTELIRAGHRAIAFLGNPPGVYTTGERFHGFRAALAAEKITPADNYVQYGQLDVRGAEDAALALLDLPRPPTAIFAANNRLTIGAYRAITARGTATALSGFDDFELADMLGLPLTVVSYDAENVGRRAAGLLIERLHGTQPSAQPPRREIVPTKLIHYGPSSPEITVARRLSGAARSGVQPPARAASTAGLSRSRWAAVSHHCGPRPLPVEIRTAAP
jgi:LacI family transcriptional regulator